MNIIIFKPAELDSPWDACLEHGIEMQVIQVKLLQAFTYFNEIEKDISNSTNVTAVIQDPNNNPPEFEVSTLMATVREGAGRGSLVQGLSMLVTDQDSVSTAPSLLLVIVIIIIIIGRGVYSRGGWESNLPHL